VEGLKRTLHLYTTKFGREIARVPGIEKKKTRVCAMVQIDFDQLRIYLTHTGFNHLTSM